MDVTAKQPVQSLQEGRPLEEPGASFVPGYHLRPIARGVFGEGSKIVEEALEFQEALEQGNDVMALVELSDMLGAMQGWLAAKHPTITIDKLLVMTAATKRAFENGHRTIVG